VRIYADLHLHSRYSAATSSEMTIPQFARNAKMKGLSLVGTGDALHPLWLRELKNELKESPDGGFYRRREANDVFFVPQVEVGTIHEFEGKARRIHHVVLMPTLEVAEDLGDRLSAYGNMASDGRPVLTMSPAELVDIVKSSCNGNFIFPAHAWTPWWSIFGSFSGVDRMEECYEDRASQVHALETGLSSDPAMNWRVSSLDRYSLLSCSDSHSPWPFRIGREASVFDLPEMTLKALTKSIVNRDPNRFLMTIEVNPAYGKGLGQVA